MDKPTPPESRFAPGQECEHGQLARSCGLCDRDYEIAELRAQVAQYKEDAERYRWLRESIRLQDVPPDQLDAEVDKARKTT